MDVRDVKRLLEISYDRCVQGADERFHCRARATIHFRGLPVPAWFPLQLECVVDGIGYTDARARAEAEALAVAELEKRLDDLFDSGGAAISDPARTSGR
jgi:hypothetical protein